MAAPGAPVGAGPVLVPEGAGEGALRALLPKDAVLLGGQLGTPFGVGLGLRVDALGVRHASNATQRSIPCVARRDDQSNRIRLRNDGGGEPWPMTASRWSR